MSRRTALVTGGGGAIAEQIARRLEARGYDLVLADVSRPRMEQVAGTLARPATLLDCDLSTIEGIREFAASVERDHADLDLLVNNAGYIEPGDVAELDADEIDRHAMVNLVAPMQLTRSVLQGMLARGRGDILAIVSMGGIIALRGSGSYSATKFGLRGFHTSLQQELAGTGVRVMGVFPSGVDTPMLRKEAVHASGSPLNFVGKVLTNSGGGTSGSVLAGMNWAVANRCQVISMSLGAQTGVQAAYTAAGNAALANGCLIIAAAGNAAAATGAPANSPSIMSVASLDPTLTPSSFSNFGKVEIAAPGRDVFSSVPRPTRYGIKSGTSMATPHVAGVAALWAQTSASLRGVLLWRKLQATARPLPFPIARVGRGLVQAP